MVQVTKDDYNRVLKVLPAEAHPGFENMNKVPGRQSIITVIASIYIIHLERQIRLLRNPASPTEDLDREIAALEQQKEDSMTGNRSLTKSEKIFEDQQRFQKLESLIPRDGSYILCGRLWILIAAGEYIQALQNLIQDLKSNDSNHCGSKHFETCNRPYCPIQTADSIFQPDYDTLDLDYRPFNRTEVEISPEPLWYDCWSDIRVTEEDVAPYLAHIAPPTREANTMVRNWMLRNRIDAQLEHEREESLRLGRDPDVPTSGSLASAIQIVRECHGGDAALASSLEYLAAMAMLQQFTERVFAERGPLDWISKWHPPRVHF
ncbi:hypothetical protein VKT23_008935 [Stygiomarasmius scandens]|uniref:Uncharacterized protein n=1 Tax=Marasmiellus scandens TaxID=2682957 RepID=A0ABR1JK74_9AGAR